MLITGYQATDMVTRWMVKRFDRCDGIDNDVTG